MWHLSGYKVKANNKYLAGWSVELILEKLQMSSFFDWNLSFSFCRHLCYIIKRLLTVNSRFLAIVALTALSVTAFSSNANAGLAVNGLAFNGTQLNGSNLNGVTLNGISVNGVRMNGTSVNGSNLNGSNLNGSNLNGSNLNGANLNGRNVNGEENQNAAVAASSETGMVLSSPEFTEIQVEEGRLVGVK
ncbi:pentapeptide repeat-containing protein [Trichocoleus desertorum AS-A10]|uniref:pentapeptide repeat-containing protein n=1 Tax=Trichocoleus desertorum TaxID=1481672 RepID=UPI003299B83C